MPEETDDTPSRRAVLAGIATAAGAATSGCTTLPSFGQQVRFGSVETPATDRPRYRDWLPHFELPDGARADDDIVRAHVEYLEPGNRGRELLGTPVGGQSVKPAMDHVGIEFESIDWAVEYRRSVVARTTVDVPTVERALDPTGYEPYGSYEGYRLYERDDLNRVIAVGEESLVFSGYVSEPTEYVTRYIDAGAGRTTRRHEAQDGFGSITDEVGAPSWTRIRAGTFNVGGSTARLRARSVEFDDERVYAGRQFLFEAGADVTESEIRAQISQYPEALEATRVDVQVDGPLVTVVGQLPPESYRTVSTVELYDQPIITWGLDWSEGDTTATLTHEAGDTVDASVFTVGLQPLSSRTDSEGDPSPRPSRPTDEQFADHYDRIEPGDSLSIDVGGLDRWRLFVHGDPPVEQHTWLELAYLPPSMLDEP